MAVNSVSRPSSGGTLDGSHTKGIRMNDTRTVHVERGPFEMVPHWILFHRDLSALAVRLYLALRKHADAQGDCFPSRQRLADLLGVGVPTLDRARKQLVSAGAIEVRHRRGNDDRWLSSLYRVRWHPINEIVQGEGSILIQAGIKNDALTKTHLSTKPKDQDLSPTEPVGQGEVAEPEALPGLPQPLPKASRLLQRGSFDDFWKAYPRKVGKRAAQQAYADAIKGTSPDVILSAAMRYAADPNREQQFTVHPTTWLRQGRWDDEPLPARKSAQTGGTRRMDNYAEIHERINRAKGITAS